MSQCRRYNVTHYIILLHIIINQINCCERKKEIVYQFLFDKLFLALIDSTRKRFINQNWLMTVCGCFILCVCVCSVGVFVAFHLSFYLEHVLKLGFKHSLTPFRVLLRIKFSLNFKRNAAWYAFYLYEARGRCRILNIVCTFWNRNCLS